MYKFSKKSYNNYLTLENNLKLICDELLRYYDFSLIYGYRDIETQFELYQRGRILKDGFWQTVDKLQIVTNCDGYKIKSAHNFNPARAMDIIPYPSGYKKIEEFYRLSGAINVISSNLGIKIKWGGDWKFQDLPHFELDL